MNNIELVNNKKHAKTRVITRKGKDLGDGVMLSHTFPSEFRFLQTQYPILFQKDVQADSFYAVALFGFEEGENLFLSEAGWMANYVPLMMRRQPFHIGFVRDATSESDMRVMHINMDSPRISETEGEFLFAENGENSDFLNYMADMLETIHQWNKQSEEFYAALKESDLLESVNFDITLPNGFKSQLLGFYTINEDRLNGLSGHTLERLNKKGFLLPIYMAIASIDNIKKLIALRNEK